MNKRIASHPRLPVALAGAALTLAALLAGCAAPPPQAGASAAPVFYPQAPDPPRVQYLTRFANARDLPGDRSAMASFVLGEEGMENALKRPYGAALFEGKLYVADSRLPGVVVFDLAGGKYSVIEGTGAGRFKRPINVTIDGDGTKYVTDTGRDEVLVLDRANRFVAAFGEKGGFKPVDAVISGDRLYVSDIGHDEIRVLDKRSGKLLFKFGKRGGGDGEFYQLTNLARTPEGDICAVETGNFRVSCFSAEGKFLRRFGQAGQAPGTFARPKGIAIDREGRLYVGDAAFQNVQIFDRHQRVLMAFGQPAGTWNGLNLPAGLSIDYDNVALFQRYAAPDFKLEYLVLVVSQFGPDQVEVFGFGRKEGVSYPAEEAPAKKPGG